MSNDSKHTPGPWHVVNGVDVFTSLGAKNAEGIEEPINDGWHVADCAMEDLSYRESNANARLIAAAPDLLEALELIVMERAWYRSERPEGYNIEDRLNAWEETARAAIAKAKGEQQC